MMAMTPFASTHSQLPAPPDKQMYGTDPLQSAIALNLSTKQTTQTMEPDTDTKDDSVLSSPDKNATNKNGNTTPPDHKKMVTLPPKIATINHATSALSAGHMEVVESNRCMLEFSAILASHGWVSMGVDKTKLPYVVRGNGQRLLPLCMVEKTFLAAYPGPYPEKELGRAPMMGFYLTTEEVRLLNRFVNQTYTQRYGLGRFSLKDMLVAVHDFTDFYQRVKSMVPYTAAVVTAPLTDEQHSVLGGWSQVNNTIVPYVMRNRVKMVPLSVVRYASGLLNEVEVPSLGANPDECEYLNDVCSEVGLSFNFEGDTKLIELFLVPTLSDQRVSITELPKKEPLKHARFVNRNNDRRSVFVAASVRTQELSKGKVPKVRAIKSPTKQVPVPVVTSVTPPSTVSNVPTGPHILIPVSASNFQSPPPLVKQISVPSTPQTVAQTTAPGPTIVQMPLLSSPVSQALAPMQTISQPVSVLQQLPAPQIIVCPNQPSVPVQGIKICPQHGIRTIMTPQPNIQPGQLIISPPGLQSVTLRPLQPNSSFPQRQPQPIMIIRLDKPIPPGAPLPMVLPPNMLSPIIVQSPVMPSLTTVRQEPVTQEPPVVIKIESDDENNEDHLVKVSSAKKRVEKISSSIISETAIKTEIPDKNVNEVIQTESCIESGEQLSNHSHDNNNDVCNDKPSDINNSQAVSLLLNDCSQITEQPEIDDSEVEGPTPAKRTRVQSGERNSPAVQSLVADDIADDNKGSHDGEAESDLMLKNYMIGKSNDEPTISNAPSLKHDGNNSCANTG